MHTKTNQEEVLIKGFFLGRCIAFVAGDCKLFAVLSEARLGEMRLCFPFLSFPVEKLLSGAAADCKEKKKKKDQILRRTTATEAAL